MHKKQKIIIIFISVMILGLFLIKLTVRGKETTDNATIEAHTITISPKVPGYVITLNVKDNQIVNQGDTILEIDPRDYQLKVDVAHANAMSAKVEAKNASINAKRQIAIAHTLAGSQKETDSAITAAEAAEARLEVATAQLSISTKDLADTKILAPVNGTITNRSVEKGSYVNTGSKLLTLVGTERWVVANFKEVQIADMRPGQKAKISVDAYPDLELFGHVDSIQSGTGARFSAFPAENATGNFIKIVQRVPVKIIIDTPLPQDIVIGPGLSVIATVITGGKS